MWCSHSFSQRNKTTERAVGGGGGEIGDDRERGGGLDKNLKNKDG